MDASYVGGTIHVPRIFWGQAWFDENCLPGEESTCDTYTIKKFKEATTRGLQTVAACVIFDAGDETKDKNYHVTMCEIEAHKHNGMKIGAYNDIIDVSNCVCYVLFAVYTSL